MSETIIGRASFDKAAILSQLAGFSWESPHYRSTIVACLVQGTYELQLDQEKEKKKILQHDPQKNNQVPPDVAPNWWKTFGFKLHDTLFDEHDGSIFCGIYEYETWSILLAGQYPPRYVVAFRGTMLTRHTSVQDLRLDSELLRHNLHKRSRCLRGLQAVQNIVNQAAETGGGNVWLAGHSLGSAIALFVGKKMAANDSLLETYLFNPPFVSFLSGHIIIPKPLKDWARKLNSVTKAALVAVVGAETQTSYSELSEWIPNLFINLSDRICCEYNDYFENRDKMRELGAGAIEELAAQNSKRGILYALLGLNRDAVHFIPSACITINPNPSDGHGIKQWYMCMRGLHMNAHSKNYKSI